MKWSTPADLRQQLQRSWDKGEILGALLGKSAFPRRLTLKTPTATELRDHFDAVRSWSQQLRDLPHIRLEMRDFRHQVFGQNSLPDAAWIDDAESAIALLGKQKEARIFAQILASTAPCKKHPWGATFQPKLLPWLARRPLKALELADSWARLLAVIAWLQAHPRPGIYVRQMDVADVHSKFVEANRGVLTELLDLALPPDSIDATATGSSGFNQRYGFLDKPERIRLRWLDAAASPFPLLAEADMTLDAASFARLNVAVDCVFITENEINFLAFPPVANALILFGAGYGFTALAAADWLKSCRMYYWGDLDTHGFAILDELRSHFPPVQSLLMDRATLLAGQSLWTEEATPTQRNLPRLQPDERAVYDVLRDNRLGKNLRLEQERIPFAQLQPALGRIQST
jgi:hypothetical protein